MTTQMAALEAAQHKLERMCPTLGYLRSVAGEPLGRLLSEINHDSAHGVFWFTFLERLDWLEAAVADELGAEEDCVDEDHIAHESFVADLLGGEVAAAIRATRTNGTFELTASNDLVHEGVWPLYDTLNNIPRESVDAYEGLLTDILTEIQAVVRSERPGRLRRAFGKARQATRVRNR